MAGFQGKKIHPSCGGLSRGRGVKVNKIDPCAIGVELAGCQGEGGVKVNKIDPCAIKTSLKKKTGDQIFELRGDLFLSLFEESKEALLA